MATIGTCLWFDSEALEAANFYVSLFPRSRITGITRYGKATAKAAGRRPGSVLTVSFTLDGRPFMALNGGPMYRFTEAVSLVIQCRTQAEIDRYWKRLSKGGEVQRCGWLKDRYGLSWQVVPAGIENMLGDPDPAREARVSAALHGMVKIDLPALKRAHSGR